jgi:hypothetical protein
MPRLTSYLLATGLCGQSGLRRKHVQPVSEKFGALLAQSPKVSKT